MAETIEDRRFSVVDCFRAKVSGISNPKTLQSIDQAVDTFHRFMGGTPVAFDDLNEELLSEWISWLFYHNYSYSTVLLYLKNLSSLYGKIVKDGLINDNGCFKKIKAKLRDVSTGGVEINSDPQCFQKLRQLVHADCSKNAQRQLAKDIVLFAVYNGGMTFEKLSSYKKTDYEGTDKSVLEIVDRYSKPKNKYLFPLNQSEKTPKQLYRTISALFSDALKMVNINLSTYNYATSINLWAMAAMRCGIAASDIAGCIGQTSLVNPIFSFASKRDLSITTKAGIRQLVSLILTKDPDNWYAMQFRPRVNYDMIKQRMKAMDIRFKDSFYPMEEIIRRVGKKMVSESKPIVPGLLFFKCKASELPEIFFHIGDLAWGYRQTRNVRSPYAVISHNDIQIYQNTIGKFTSNMQIFPSGTVALRDGDKVEIIGGNFIGRPARFEKEIEQPSKETDNVKRIIYRLKLMGDNNIEWVVDLDPRLVSKISDEQYDKLQRSSN